MSNKHYTIEDTDVIGRLELMFGSPLQKYIQNRVTNGLGYSLGDTAHADPDEASGLQSHLKIMDFRTGKIGAYELHQQAIKRVLKMEGLTNPQKDFLLKDLRRLAIPFN